MNEREPRHAASIWAVLAFLAALVIILTIGLLALIDHTILLTPFDALMDIIRDDPSRAITGQ